MTGASKDTGDQGVAAAGDAGDPLVALATSNRQGSPNQRISGNIIPLSSCYFKHWILPTPHWMTNIAMWNASEPRHPSQNSGCPTNIVTRGRHTCKLPFASMLESHPIGHLVFACNVFCTFRGFLDVCWPAFVLALWCWHHPS